MTVRIRGIAVAIAGLWMAVPACDGGAGGTTSDGAVPNDDAAREAAADRGGEDSSGTGGVAGSGGVPGSGGRNGSGGGFGSGGVFGSGGRAGSGGASGSGGRAGSGGASGSGGRAGSGGASGSGGKPTIYLAGDSTVQTYSAAQAPQQGWGQRIAELFTNDVVFVNKAIGGRSSKSFVDEGRLDEIVRLLKPGDYLFAQWGINDRYTSDPARYTNPSTTFKDYLRMYIEGARSKNATPVLVTPTPRLDYSNGVFHNDFPAYCTAIEEVGAETSTTVIDLQSKGLAYYTSLGYEKVSTDICLDVLHFKTEGAYQMARLVAEGVKESALPISAYVK